jgi:hypothetical protein
MKHTFIPSIIVSSLFCCGLMAAPQAPPSRYESSYSATGARDFRDTQRMFDGVRSDLDQAENNLPAYAASRDQFDRVRGELSDLQHHWDESTYEPRQADDVIGALERALDSRDLLPRDRSRLTQDLRFLRDFRDSHE